MADLIAKSPLDGFAPMTIGSVTMTEMDCGPITSVAPFKGQSKALAENLKALHGMAMPSPNRMTGREGARAIWFGKDQMILMGINANTQLGEFAALTDQSDGWTVVELQGDEATDVLARLTPLDLRKTVFKRGRTARSDLMHMAASISRPAQDTFMIMVFRSMAGTLLHDLQRAMEGVASRR